MTRRKLRDYQKIGVRFCLQTDHPGLFWDMRLGKTLVIIRTEKVRGTDHILVVAPYSAILSWEEELENENQSYITLDGETKNRISIIENNFHKVKYFLISKEGHRWSPEIKDFQWGTVILDEGHCISNYNESSKFFTQNFRDVEKRYILTGTPALESELQYFNLLQWLDHKNWSFKNYWGFRFKLFTQIGYDWLVNPGAYDKISKVVAKSCHVLKRSDLNLNGEVIETIREIELTKKAQAIYNRLEKDFALSAENKETISTVWATTKYLWLRRLCGGWYDKEFISYGKIRELEYLLKTELNKEQVVIFCEYRKEVIKVEKILSKLSTTGMIHGRIPQKKRREVMVDFRKGKIQYLICQHTSVTTGANFSNADVEVFYSLPESGTTFYQVRDRFIKVGDTGSKLIIYLLFKNTVEKTIYYSLKNKLTKAERLAKLIQYFQRKWRKK